VTKVQLARQLMGGRLGGLVQKITSQPGVLVLAYHRIGDGSTSPFDRGLWSATPDNFERQVKFLKLHADPIGPEDLRAALNKKRDRHFLITFDDGYRDNFDVVYPILKQHNIRAGFFLATGFIDVPIIPWWDEIAWMVRSSPLEELKASQWLSAPLKFDEPDRQLAVEHLLKIYKTMPGDRTAAFIEYLATATASGRCTADAAKLWMNWDMIREMRGAGMWFGGHTHTHPILSRLTRSQQLKEIATCRRRIEEELSQRMRWFSYPRGKPDAFDNETRDCLQEEGVELAFTYYGGYERLEQWDAYDIRRTAVEMDTSMQQFRAMVQLPDFFA